MTTAVDDVRRQPLHNLVAGWSLMALILLPALAHVAPGDVDFSFGPGSGVDGTVRAIAGQSDETPLSVAISASSDPVQPGGQLTYTLTVTNRGLDDLSAVNLAATVPALTSVKSGNVSVGGTCSGILSCHQPKRVQALCDGLSAEKIDGLLRKWFRKLPHPFTGKDRQAVRRQLFLRIDDNYFSRSTTITF